MVEITDGDALYYRTNLFYDLAKTSVIRLAFAMSEELREHGVAAVSVTPDPDVMKRTGGLYSSWQLAAEYGFEDIDGTRPDWGRHAASSSFGEEQRASNERFVELASGLRPRALS